MTGAPAASGMDRLRILTLAGVLLAHGVGLWLLHDLSQLRPRPSAAAQALQVVEIVFVAPPAPPLPPPPRRAARPVATSPSPPSRRMQVAEVAPPPIKPSQIEPSPESVAPPAPRLFAGDGSLRGVAGHVEALQRDSALEGRFDYEIPGLAGAGDAFKRPLALEYRASAFDEFMHPQPDMLTEILEKAVEATMLTVKIPVPGAPGHKVVCSVVVIAAAGGCGMERPEVVVMDVDDPDTLSPEEARACEVLWEKLRTTRTQAEALRLRRVYEMGCRLPLAE